MLAAVTETFDDTVLLCKPCHKRMDDRSRELCQNGKQVHMEQLLPPLEKIYVGLGFCYIVAPREPPFRC